MVEENNMSVPDFSVIIPQRNSVKTLPKLLDSIPPGDAVEVIVVDNNPEPISKAEIKSKRDFKLLWSSPEKFAGGARNRGIEAALGKWLIFADADDYFTSYAFDVFKKHLNDNHDVIYFSARGEYADGSGSTSRAAQYDHLIDGYLGDTKKEIDIRLYFSVPWAKMVRRQFVEDNGFRFDEVTAANDAYFSLMTGYYAKTITASKDVVYVVTTSKGSLTKRKDEAAIWSRYEVGLRKNKFLREHDLSDKQSSLMVFIAESRHYGLKSVLRFLMAAFKYRQNIFIGWKRWLRTYQKTVKQERKESQYYTQ